MHTQPIATAPDQAAPDPGDLAFHFGQYTLFPARKLLACGDGAVVLGGRAFDLLVALVLRAGEVVSHHDLVGAVWPHAVVEENGLRVHMSALRKALGDSPTDQFIDTVLGCGYRFVKPVSAGPGKGAPGPAARQGDRASTQAGQALEQPWYGFGPFRLQRQARQLCLGATPVRVGGRALELLFVLVERAGEVVSHAELERSIWPDSIVEDSCLRVHIGALRKALGEGAGGARYIANVPGRGYSFVAPVGCAGKAPPDGLH